MHREERKNYTGILRGSKNVVMGRFSLKIQECFPGPKLTQDLEFLIKCNQQK